MSMPSPFVDPPPARSRTRLGAGRWLMYATHPATVVVLVTVVVALTLVVIYLERGFPAEPPYAVWCDGGTDGNRIYVVETGPFTREALISPRDPKC